MKNRIASGRLMGSAAALLLAACVPPPSPPITSAQPATTSAAAPRRDSVSVERVQYASTYTRRPDRAVLIRDAHVLTAAGPEMERASVLLRDGKIVAIGASVEAPADALIVDGRGKWVTPGLIDSHSHLGVYSAPGTQAESDGNEATNPVTAEVWAEHSIWPQDPQIPLAVAGGVTMMQVLPGSANLIGGRSATVRLVPARTVQEMKVPGAQYGVKMACGENPKRVYQNRGPSTRMGNMAGYRQAFADAEQYRARWDAWLRTRLGDPPARNLRQETLAEVLRGNILVHIHCYRGDEMAQMIDLSKEFGFRIRSFHHVVEGYKVADLLAANGIASSLWADWWGFKMESYDGIPFNAALVQQAGGRVIIHSDSPEGIQRLNQEAGKAMQAGRQVGIAITREQAIQWITLNPAWALGVDKTTGTLEVGKAADVVVWSGDPFSIYSKAEKVFNEGWLAFDRLDPARQFKTDFNLGQTAPGIGK
jgi:imidazolonepropionase-like amidohydrolase